MSNTRHAPPGSPLSPNRYASSRENARELHGNLVALRCATLDRPADKELIFALQWIVNELGSTEVAARLLADYGTRIGTRSMRKLGIKPAQQCNADQVKVIRRELPDQHADEFLLRGESDTGKEVLATLADDWENSGCLELERARAAKRPASFPAAQFLDICHSEAKGHLADDVLKLCLDPAGDLASGPWYFHDLINCLREFVAAWAPATLKQIRDGFARTELSRAIFTEIEDAHSLGGCVLLHNSAGTGKSYAAEAACAAYPGRARYVLTPASNCETDFWRAVARAAGTADGKSFKCEQIRIRAADALLGSGLALVLDNAQNLFPLRDYRYALPQRLDQILQLAEQGVPVVMLADSKMFDTLGFVEARTGWDRGKFVNQLTRVVELPAGLPKEDVQAVAAAQLPDGDRAAQRKLADAMIASLGYLHAGKSTAQRARRIAASRGRANVTLADMDAAVETCVRPAEAAKLSALKRADEAKSKCGGRVRNWRPDTEAQIATKAGKRRNAIVTSSDLNREQPRPTSAPLETKSRRTETPLQGSFSDPEATEFPRSRSPRVPGDAEVPAARSAELVAA